jgi:uncharacterized membrane protein
LRRASDLTTPRTRRVGLGLHYDPEAFGRFSETIARTLGTARFLVIQTAFVILWITFNVVAAALRYDPYPFILLNLAFSTQAAYAAPLILLAQNRQDERDRSQIETDREVAFRTQADAEYLAREVASIRLSVNALPTGEELEHTIERLTAAVERLEARLTSMPPAAD